ncbi:uncharacterized protein LOC142322512 isoform X7 [Lycorma delicatula]|uniref:uncharacterized protein LOC142322512 isoform X7 n=1 Tax=Lycorma delicatula TaxID=130591 RepID=UPI003F51A5E0
MNMAAVLVGDSFLEEDPLCTDVKIEIKNEILETECVFLPVAMTEDDLASEHITDSSTDYSFENKDPLSTKIKIEIKQEMEETECLFESFVKTEEEEGDLIYRQDIVVEAVDNSVEENMQSKNYSNEKINSPTNNRLKLHNNSDIECSSEHKYCEKTFRCKNALTYNVNAAGTKKEYKCRYCQRLFSRSNDLKKHVTIHTVITSTICLEHLASFVLFVHQTSQVTEDKKKKKKKKVLFDHYRNNQAACKLFYSMELTHNLIRLS